MKKYREKLQEIMAEQWFLGKTVEGVRFGEMTSVLAGHNVSDSIDIEIPPYVNVVGGFPKTLKEGDWVIKDRGGYRVISDKEFRAQFDPIE